MLHWILIVFLTSLTHKLWSIAKLQCIIMVTECQCFFEQWQKRYSWTTPNNNRHLKFPFIETLQAFSVDTIPNWNLPRSNIEHISLSFFTEETDLIPNPNKVISHSVLVPQVISLLWIDIWIEWRFLSISTKIPCKLCITTIFWRSHVIGSRSTDLICKLSITGPICRRPRPNDRI